MSNFDNKTLIHLEKLCRITCTEEEREKLLDGLQKIICYVEQLNEVDTSKVKPCSSVLEDKYASPLRKDEPCEKLSRDLFLQNVPEQINFMVKIPPILNQTKTS